MLAEFMIVTIEDGNFKYKAYFQNNRDMRACVRACMRAYVRACVRACVHVCRTHVRACVRACTWTYTYYHYAQTK